MCFFTSVEKNRLRPLGGAGGVRTGVGGGGDARRGGGAACAAAPVAAPRASTVRVRCVRAAEGGRRRGLGGAVGMGCGGPKDLLSLRPRHAPRAQQPRGPRSPTTVPTEQHGYGRHDGPRGKARRPHAPPPPRGAAGHAPRSHDHLVQPGLVDGQLVAVPGINAGLGRGSAGGDGRARSGGTPHLRDVHHHHLDVRALQRNHGHGGAADIAGADTADLRDTGCRSEGGQGARGPSNHAPS